MNIYVTRHGETEWNTYWKLQGRSNTVLNEKGREQACLTHNGFVGYGKTNTMQNYSKSLTFFLFVGDSI